ncbi:MAG: HEPN domain-containing protein [Afipia sp.]
MSKHPKAIKPDFGPSVFALEADKDYLTARMINSLGQSLGSRAGFFGQQACEKYLKAVSIQFKGEYLETHQLSVLASHCEDVLPFLTEQAAKDDLSKFDLFEQIGRYGAAAKFDPLSKGKSVGGMDVTIDDQVNVAGMWVWTAAHVEVLDKVVYFIRGHLDFANMPYDDNLHSIVVNNERNLLVSTWNGPPTIYDVLTTGNSYFNPSRLRK